MNIIDTQLSPKRYLCWRMTLAASDLADEAFYVRSFDKLYAAMAPRLSDVAGKPSLMYFAVDDRLGVLDVGVCLAVNNVEATADRDLSLVDIPACNAAMAVHYGPYVGLKGTHDELVRNLQARGRAGKPPKGMPMAIEEFIVHPRDEPDRTKLKTNIYYLIP